LADMRGLDWLVYVAGFVILVLLIIFIVERV
jgi:uncharacterized integral membrane protein